MQKVAAEAHHQDAAAAAAQVGDADVENAVGRYDGRRCRESDRDTHARGEEAAALEAGAKRAGSGG